MSRKKCPKNENSLGGRLRSFRKSKKMEVISFSILIGISHGSLSDIENNNTKPSSKPIDGLIRNTDINIYWLYTGEGEMIRQGAECDTCIYNKVEDFKHRVAESRIEYDPKILEMLKMTRTVLESGTEFSDSLAANIRSFFHSVQMEKRLSDVESRLSFFEDKIKNCPTGSEGSGVK